MTFATFIITYNRPELLRQTIFKLLEQTVQAEKILIVDNSSNTETRDMIAGLDLPHIEYLSTGSNLGPAGGAAVGIRTLANQGFEAIHWQDDDDPPRSIRFNEKLLSVLTRSDDIGMVGSSGTRVDRRSGKLIRYKDRELTNKEVVEVDCVGGNQHIILRAEVFLKHGCHPESDLFFGFEDLDIGLKIRSKGYRILVPTDLLLGNRRHHNRLNLAEPTAADAVAASENAGWRQYYSYRSLMYIYLHEQKLYLAAVQTAIRGVGKGFISLLKNNFTDATLARYIVRGILDGSRKKLGFTVQPRAKYN